MLLAEGLYVYTHTHSYELKKKNLRYFILTLPPQSSPLSLSPPTK